MVVCIAWSGASILCSLSTIESFRVTKEEWEDEGEVAVHRKVF